MKSSIPSKFWQSLHDVCLCTHLRSGHATQGKGKCLITNCICKKFDLLRAIGAIGDKEDEETNNNTV